MGARVFIGKKLEKVSIKEGLKFDIQKVIFKLHIRK
jgi:hypothetical protein